MGRFQDLVTTQQGWIHELAKAEVFPDAEKLFQLDRSFNSQQLVEESTIQFLTELRHNFNEHLRVFNAYSENNLKFQEIKIYSITQTAADFMLFRNQIKLIFSNAAHGVIQTSFAQHVRGALAIDGQDSNVVQSGVTAAGGVEPQELLAQVGPFRDVSWTFHGEKVSPEQIAKFYFTEFSRVSRDLRRSKVGNQHLLDQIKALLQEKGLDL